MRLVSRVAPPGRGTWRRRCGSSFARRPAGRRGLSPPPPPPPPWGEVGAGAPDPPGGPRPPAPAALAALVWVNVDAGSYDSLWSTTLSIRVSDASVALDLRDWVNSGLMTFFFFVVGLEARREFDLGELRERRRFALPLLAGVGGMAVGVAIFLAVNAGRPSSHGWGVAMSTDTAFALGLLALVGPRFPDRLRAFMLTVVVVDDVIALLVIATVYTEDLRIVPLLAAIGFYTAVFLARWLPVKPGLICLVLGTCAWVSLLKAGV